MTSIRRPSGFTLVEVLVVLAIISLMVALAVPRYVDRLEDAREAALREKAEQVGSAEEELKTADPKRAWESLRRLTGLVSSKPALCAVVDAEGKEHVGETRRRVR